jgi:hypothetical protein
VLKAVTGLNGRPEPGPPVPEHDVWWGQSKAGGSTYAKFVGQVSRPASLADGEPVRLAVYECAVRNGVFGGYRRIAPPPYFWAHGARVYSTNHELEPTDVLALLLEDENKLRLRLEKAHALMAMREQLDSKAKRQPIPQQVKVAVWQRDRGRCVECDSQQNLEYDHIIPLAMGGSNSERNLQLLCEICNRRKGPTLG